MKYFAVITGMIFLFYILGFLNKKFKETKGRFMDTGYTTAVKGFAILTVVWAHSGARLGAGGIQFVAGVGVCLFLMCSGYGLEMSCKKNGLDGFWRKRFLRVAVPFWFVELAGLAVTGKLNAGTYFKDMFFIKAATGYGWFMQYIVICYVLFYTVKLLTGKKSVKCQMVFMVSLSALWFVTDSLFFADPDMPFLKARQMFSFPLGMLIAEYKDAVFGKFAEGRLTRKIIPAVIAGGGYNRHCPNGCYPDEFGKGTSVYFVEYS